MDLRVCQCAGWATLYRQGNTGQVVGLKNAKKLRLITREGLTRAAIVLFGKDPGEFYPNLFVKIGRFGRSDVDLRFQEVCEGNLIQIFRDVMEQLEKKFLIKPVRFEGIQRIEEKEFGKGPAKAFEIICRHPEFTAEQIAGELGKTAGTVENYIAKLKKSGFIVRRAPKLGGHWEIIE